MFIVNNKVCVVYCIGPRVGGYLPHTVCVGARYFCQFCTVEKKKRWNSDSIHILHETGCSPTKYDLH